MNQIERDCILFSEGKGVFSRIVVICAWVWAALVSSAGFLAAGESQIQTKSFAASPGDTIVVQSDFGRIRIRGGDIAEVQARIELVSSEKQQPEFQVASQKNGHEIYFYSFFSGQSQESVNFDIQAPRFMNVVVWGANPEVEVLSLQGSVRVQNISGNISLGDLASSVAVASDRGDILYRANAQPHGDVRLESTSGSIRCELASNLNLRAWIRGGGSIGWDKDAEVRGGWVEKQIGSLGALLNAVSINGNVRVALMAPGTVNTASMSQPISQPRAVPTDSQQTRPAASVTAPEAKPRAVASPVPPQPSPQSMPVPAGQGVAIKVDVDSVLLNVSVRDHLSNRSIAGLKKEDFQVYEDGVPQEIQNLQTTDAPFSLLLLMDVSGSTQSYIHLMKEAAISFTRQIGHDDRVAVADFNSNVQLLQDFTSDHAAAEKAINRIRSGGGTAFYDALMTCVDQYMRDVEGRKAIIVFTDGVDNQLYGMRGEGSRTPYSQLYRRIQESDTIIYTIFLDSEGEMMSRGPIGGPPMGRYPRRGGIGFPMPIPFPNPGGGYPGGGGGYPGGGRSEREAYETARQQLEEIAEQTGGRMYSPKRAQDLSNAYSQVADDLRVQYLLNYASSNPDHDGSWRAIRVEVRDHPGAVVRTRKGYYARKA